MHTARFAGLSLSVKVGDTYYLRPVGPGTPAAPCCSELKAALDDARPPHDLDDLLGFAAEHGLGLTLDNLGDAPEQPQPAPADVGLLPQLRYAVPYIDSVELAFGDTIVKAPLDDIMQLAPIEARAAMLDAARKKRDAEEEAALQGARGAPPGGAPQQKKRGRAASAKVLPTSDDDDDAAPGTKAAQARMPMGDYDEKYILQHKTVNEVKAAIECCASAECRTFSWDAVARRLNMQPSTTCTNSLRAFWVRRRAGFQPDDLKKTQMYTPNRVLKIGGQLFA